MLLLRSDNLPESPEWTYELKLDGYRAIAVQSGGVSCLFSRNGNDFGPRYPTLLQALSSLPDENCDRWRGPRPR